MRLIEKSKCSPIEETEKEIKICYDALSKARIDEATTNLDLIVYLERLFGVLKRENGLEYYNMQLIEEMSGQECKHKWNNETVNERYLNVEMNEHSTFRLNALGINTSVYNFLNKEVVKQQKCASDGCEKINFRSEIKLVDNEKLYVKLNRICSNYKRHESCETNGLLVIEEQKYGLKLLIAHVGRASLSNGYYTLFKLEKEDWYEYTNNWICKSTFDQMKDTCNAGNLLFVYDKCQDTMTAHCSKRIVLIKADEQPEGASAVEKFEMPTIRKVKKAPDGTYVRKKKDERFRCPHCTTFVGRDKYDLQRHLTKHDQSKEFACTICLERFSLKQALTRHMKIHTGERSYTCACGSAFKRSDELTSHKKFCNF